MSSSSIVALPRQYNWDELNKKTTLNRFESAFFVGLSQRAFDERIGSTFPSIKVGRRRLFLRSSLLSVLARLEQQATKKEPKPQHKKKP